jgi:signal peptidase II
MKKFSQLFIFLILLPTIILLDQLSKIWVYHNIHLYHNSTINVTPFFNIVFAWNKGISFGMMHNLMYANQIFIIISVLITLAVLIWAIRNGSLYNKIGASLVIGGAIGNLIDRAKYGAVIDFIDLHVAGYHWYIFNVADAAICIGVCILIWLDIKESKFISQVNNNIPGNKI